MAGFQRYNAAATTPEWVTASVPLTAYAGQNVKLGLVAVSKFGNNVIVDQVTVSQIPTCLKPSGLSASPLITSANLNWTENNSATSWTEEYGTPNFSLGSGIQVTASSNPFMLTGLTASTNYEYYVRSNCSGDQSTFAGPFAFRTECTAQVLPLLTDFETGWTGTTPATCWSVENMFGNAPYGWTADANGTPTGGTGPSVDHTLGNTAGKYLYVEIDGGNFVGNSAMLTSVFTNITGISSVNVEFWYHTMVQEQAA